MTDIQQISTTRTIYDPAKKDFVSTGKGKILPAVRNWINNHNPVVYWYILRIDNLISNDISQWAVELYAHQALSITEAYIDGLDRRFDLRMRERDVWSDKYVLSIPKQMGIPIVGKGTRRLYFKIDVNCEKGLMHEYGVTGIFKAYGMKDVEIKEKIFTYSCKFGEFRQRFNLNPDEASAYAQKHLQGFYSPKSVNIFTNSFRMIHDLGKYCHSDPVNQAEVLKRLHMLDANFGKVPEIASTRIIPLIQNEIDQLEAIKNKAVISPGIIHLCDQLIELLHIEVLGAEISEYKKPDDIRITAGEDNAFDNISSQTGTGSNILQTQSIQKVKTDDTIIKTLPGGKYKKENDVRINASNVNKYCPKCGQKNNHRLQYCTKCGRRLLKK